MRILPFYSEITKYFDEVESRTKKKRMREKKRRREERKRFLIKDDTP